ncbi:hypothetical protein ACLBYG_31030 [Methylobacterium sp. D53M]|jgi:hypothetical protein
MTIDLRSVDTLEKKIKPNLIVNGDGTSAIAYLNELRSLSIKPVQNIAAEIEQLFGLMSEISSKSEATAKDKRKRVAKLKKDNTITLAHIRDYLRFRTRLHSIEDFEDVLRFFIKLQSDGRIVLVKIDIEKLFKPSVFGWRMIAVDIMIPQTKMLVEHYMTFENMIEINERWLHKVYEAWRSVDPENMTLEEIDDRERDIMFSRLAYRELLFDGIQQGLEPSKLSDDRALIDEAILDQLTSCFVI